MRTAKRRTSSYVVRLEPEQLAQLRLELAGPPRPPRPPAPTIAEVFERFMTWSRANRQKPASLFTKESLWRCHLKHRLGGKRADELQLADVEDLKAAVRALSAKRTNTMLSVLRKALKLSVKRGELERLPCEIEAVPETTSDFSFYDFDAYAQLIAGAAKMGLRELAVVAIGGDAGLRMGEQLGLQRGDVDLVRRQLHVRRSDSNGELVSPKGGRGRVVDLTQLLVDVLGVLFSRSSSSRSDARVLVTVAGDHMSKAAGEVLSVQRIRTLMERAQRSAGLEVNGNLHQLRHTFCSHLAMRGASTIAIKNLAGHVSISTTERYMHLADAERQRAIGLLDQARRADPETSQRSVATGLSDDPRSNAGRRAVGDQQQQRSTQQEASGTPESAAMTPRRFELLGISKQSQADWLEHLLGSSS